MSSMHPEMATHLARQRHEEIRRGVAESRRGPVRRLPSLHLSLSRLTSGAGSSSLVIVISADRAVRHAALG